DDLVTGQTYLTGAANAIDAYGAWDITTGASTTVVAVVDTGYRPHADLTGRLLPGYDFIRDPAVANDGDGRDADASDPGDWVTPAEAGTDLFKGCDARNSAWHGTGVAGIIAANTDNRAWVAGIDWQAKILPVRVLGKCGGYTSDIIDGIAWASGLSVPGAPVNVTPADVINLSLGGPGSCSPAERNAIAAALAFGHTKAIVVAAGNEREDAGNHAPANCPGVITVASTTTAGMLAIYSNYGSTITLSAPGGQYAPDEGLDGILVLSNAGRTTPTTDSFRDRGGTSFAAPMVSGVVALMLAVNAKLDPDQIRSLLLATSRPFPLESSCATAICGAGIVDARAAVAAAQATAVPAGTVGVIEYYNASLDHYFITWIAGEIAALDAGTLIRGWQRTGVIFSVYPGGRSGSSPVCRFYIPPAYGNSHFFGRGTDECGETTMRNPAFVLESAEFMDVVLPLGGVCPAGTQPVYRVFSNRPDVNHRYMTDSAIRDQMVARGWLAEGDGPDRVVMCSPR
ncbi:MAG: S8 family peptidase, partial [Betaproteobacteria bacterium]